MTQSDTFSDDSQFHTPRCFWSQQYLRLQLQNNACARSQPITVLCACPPCPVLSMSTEAGMEQLSVADATDGPKETPEEKKARKEAEKAKKAEEKAKKEAEKVARQAQRGQKAAVITAPEAGDALGEHYGDSPLVQSRERTGTEWNRIEALTPDMEGQQVCQTTIHWVGDAPWPHLIRAEEALGALACEA